MNKEFIINNAKKKFDGELLDIVLRQVDNYFELAESNYEIENKYNIGDEVILNENHLLHGIRDKVDLLDVFSERGIISNDYLVDEVSSHAFIYNSGFWSVKNEISLKEFIINYSGMIAKYDDKWEQVPYKKLDEFVEKMRTSNAWLWTAESSMEIRFMPSLAKDNNQVAFILNTSNPLAIKLKENSIFKNTKLDKYKYYFINEKAHKDFENGFKLDAFERADYIILGFPKNCIEGVLVGRLVENNQEYLKKTKDLFPKCYICNLDGKVIY
jgi:hypothetical protein